MRGRPRHSRRSLFQFHSRGRFNNEDVFAIPSVRRARELVDFVAYADDCFGDQKTGGEFFLKGRGGLRARILTDGELHSTARIPEAIA